MRYLQRPYGRTSVMMPTGDLDPRYYKSYSMNAPLRTHWRPATCEEVECEKFTNGFLLVMDISTDLGQQQLAFVRGDRTRSCKLERSGDTLVTATYPPGNQCFASDQKRATHRVPVGRPPIYLVADGDWRGNPTGRVRTHRGPEDWVDDFQNNTDKILERQRKG